MDVRSVPLGATSKVGGFGHHQGSLDRLRLQTKEVHVWSAFLDIAHSSVRAMEHGLSDNERARANRFHFDKDRRRFIVARFILRSVLGRYLETEPSRLKFQYGPYAKPYLVLEGSEPMLSFNVSHAGGIALYAVTREWEIGVDVEPIRPEFACMEIAENFFSPREIAALGALRADQFSAAFFACWTRKEAYIKARGEGLSHPLDRFDVSTEHGKPTVLLRTHDDPREASRWTIQDLFPRAGYASAIAVGGRGYELGCWQWPTHEYYHVH